MTVNDLITAAYATKIAEECRTEEFSRLVREFNSKYDDLDTRLSGSSNTVYTI